jgi:aryl-alcohol dehydrogenase-like predicted oxidoreductase
VKEASDEDVCQLRRVSTHWKKEHGRSVRNPKKFDSVIARITEGSMLPGHATREGVDRFAAHFGKESVAFYRQAQEMLMSTLGIGTNLGPMDRETDISYARAVHAALQGGVNLIDTSLNYRHQRSERAVGEGLRTFIESGGARDGIVICTKGGYLVPGAFSENTLSADNVTGDMHSMSPAFLADQLERSRRNLRVETIDIYYLHNPETQLKFIEMPVFMNRLRAGFAELERAVSVGHIRYYGTATWHGYRNGALSLRALVEAARQNAGDNHHFRFVQLPFNLAMQEALTRREVVVPYSMSPGNSELR